MKTLKSIALVGLLTICCTAFADNLVVIDPALNLPASHLVQMTNWHHLTATNTVLVIQTNYVFAVTGTNSTNAYVAVSITNPHDAQILDEGISEGIWAMQQKTNQVESFETTKARAYQIHNQFAPAP